MKISGMTLAPRNPSISRAAKDPDFLHYHFKRSGMIWEVNQVTL
jgi:hypothetical protein